MSSRALRKLKGEDDFGIKDENIEDDDLTVTPKRLQKKNKSVNKSSNTFDVLLEKNGEKYMESSEEDVKDGSVNNEEKENNDSNPPLEVNQEKTKSRKKPRKRKKRSKVNEDENQDEEDEFGNIQMWNGDSGASATLSSVTNRGLDTKPLLTIEHRNVNAELEMCRRFGSRIVRGENGRSNHRRMHRSTWLVSPRQNWPRVGKTGLSMKSLHNKDGYTYFIFEHSPAYQTIQFKFLDAVESMDPNNISAIISVYGYHIDSLLQLSEICKLSEDHQMAAELVERALFAIECCFHPLFNVTQGKSRMDYKNAENRSFFLALFRHLQFVGQRGCYRTALELCKLLLSLSPDEDPLCVLLMIDFYALRSEEHEFLIRMYNEWEADKNLSQLPNFAYSVALAHFHHSQSHAGSTVTTANELLQQALINFPSVLVPLLDKCSVALETTMMNHDFFGVGSQASESKGLHQLVALFVGRTFSEWKSPEVIDWLANNVKLVIERVEKKDQYVEECRKKRQVRYQGTPRNIYRHILLSDIKEATTSLPVDLTMSPVMSYDPLPPVDSVAAYIRPERPRPANQQHNPLSEFFRSILPSYSLNPVAGEIEEGHQEGAGAIGGQGSAAHLTQGVETLMAAMRELLNTMTYRGDAETNRDSEDEEEQEWVD